MVEMCVTTVLRNCGPGIRESINTIDIIRCKTVI